MGHGSVWVSHQSVLSSEVILGLRRTPSDEFFFCCSFRIMAFSWRPWLTYNHAVIAIVIRILFLAGRALKPDDEFSLFLDFFSTWGETSWLSRSNRHAIKHKLLTKWLIVNYFIWLNSAFFHLRYTAATFIFRPLEKKKLSRYFQAATSSNSLRPLCQVFTARKVALLLCLYSIWCSRWMWLVFKGQLRSEHGSSEEEPFSLVSAFTVS